MIKVEITGKRVTGPEHEPTIRKIGLTFTLDDGVAQQLWFGKPVTIQFDLTGQMFICTVQN